MGPIKGGWGVGILIILLMYHTFLIVLYNSLYNTYHKKKIVRGTNYIFFLSKNYIYTISKIIINLLEGYLVRALTKI